MLGKTQFYKILLNDFLKEISLIILIIKILIPILYVL